MQKTYYRPLIEGLPCFNPPQKKLQRVDLVQLYDELWKRRDLVPEKFLVHLLLRIIYSSHDDKLSILSKLIPHGKEDTAKNTFKDSHFTCCLQNHSKMGRDYAEDEWWQEDSHNSPKISGDCIYSMISFIKGCNHHQAIEYCFELLGCDSSKGIILQPDKNPGSRFIENADVYPSHGSDQAVKIIIDQIYEKTDESYIFCNQFGRPSYKLIVWRENGWPPLPLFMTKQLFIESGRFLETMLAPPWNGVIYNLHLILQQKEAVIYIHDDIGRTIDWAEPGVNTWSGEIEYTGKIDWSVLKGRSVCYVFNHNCPASCKIGNKLNDVCSKMGVELEFISVA